MNRLFYGDNLPILRERIGDETVDLIYLDPPFNANVVRLLQMHRGVGNVGVGMIRDLIATVERENAEIGVFLTLEDPTTRMRSEAAAAGFYKSPLHGKFAKIQILTVEDLFSGARPHLPWIDSSVFRKAKRENTNNQGNLDL